MGVVIAAFSRALAAGDLAPGLRPTAYFDRGIAYVHTGQCALARADFDMALKLQPGYSQTIFNRGRAEVCLGQFDAALADFTAVAATEPSGFIYFDIGRANWAMGNFTSASDAFQKALKLTPQQPYDLLWLAISRMHDKSFNAQTFADHFSDMSVDDWPLPVFQFFLGKITIADLTAEAGKGDVKAVPGQKCEADFYGGEWQLTHGDVRAGKALFQDAAHICPKNFVERAPAQRELKRLQ